jgi:hypothetical protein
MSAAETLNQEVGHTAGPWELADGGIRVIAPSAGMVQIKDALTVNPVERHFVVHNSAHTDTKFGSDEQQANARLIAAAPELLEALKEISESIHATKKISRMAKQAIAKASGGQS